MKKEKDLGLVPMNDSLCNELYVKELETRLETDPLVVGGLLSFIQSEGDSSFFTEGHCGEYTMTCKDYTW